jgi:hypothetical protein
MIYSHLRGHEKGDSPDVMPLDSDSLFTAPDPKVKAGGACGV